ncbi:nitroreductase family protein [Chitinasiproducens palmae]|uniref:Nitroreductase n=1 Tax=Chitinasiproducens palmae TaxID=1770053 RepID=A0A1H2PTH1_9BURK|nr:nitroreductase family protein [Chitinasiproducens palmae]SDV50405.1 Nitroreductase [Chitinasiproducens palmae]
MHNPALTETAIHDLLSGRWSARALADKPVTPEQIHALLEAARWAPSAYNVQPWRFVVWDKQSDAASYERAFSALVPFNQGWVKPASLLVGVFANKLNGKGEPNRTAAYDAGAAAFALTLQAHALGLVAHQMTGYDQQKLRSEFAIPDDVEALALIAIAPYGDPTKLDDALRERETGPRSRLPLSQIAFAGEWGKGFGE